MLGGRNDTLVARCSVFGGDFEHFTLYEGKVIYMLVHVVHDEQHNVNAVCM